MRAEPSRISLLPVKWALGALASAAVLVGAKRRALQCYERIAEIDPADQRAGNTVGNLRMELGDAAGAARAFEHLLAGNPRNATAWFNLGFIHDKRGADPDAERCFRAAIEIDPKLDRAWYGLGLVLIRQGRLEEAVKALEHNTALQPFSPFGWYQLAMTHHHLGQDAQAWRIHDQLQRFEPRYAATLKRDLEQGQLRAAGGTPQVSTDSSSKEAIATIA